MIERPVDCEIRSVIRFSNTRYVKPDDINRQISEVYGENAMSDGMVRKCVRKFPTKVVITCTTSRGAAGRLWSQATTFYEEGILKLVPRYDK
jgi:hypothetical protein